MPTYAEDIVAALETLGGVASLAEIYLRVRELRAPPHPVNLNANVRNAIESHSSDSKNFSGADLFRSVNGIRKGVWALRSSLLPTPPASDLDISSGNQTPVWSAVMTYRIIRDTALAVQVKALHRGVCQLCGDHIDLPNGRRYSEAHHIRPLGQKHCGPDVPENLIVLCPNHHVLLDYGVIPRERAAINSSPKHTIADEFIDYHNRFIWRKV